MAFQPARLKGLLKAKDLRPDEVSGFGRGTVSNWANGNTKPGDEAQHALAVALDATMDYFHALRDDYADDYERAAREMAFDIFEKDASIDDELRQRCKRVRGHDAAPRTVVQWKAFADMVEKVIGPQSPRFEVIPGRK